MLILLSGCSGSGKNTIIKELLRRNPNLKFLKSCTTRAPRKGEDIYSYLSKDEFDNCIKQGKMVEYEEIHQNFYGLLKSVVDEVIDSHDKNIHFIKDVGVLGQINLSHYLKDKVKVLSIFITVPKRELVKRLTERGEKEIELRLSRMEFEMGYINNFDEVINNINLEKTLTRIEKLIAKALKQ